MSSSVSSIRTESANSYFAETARTLVDNGWSVFPQSVDRKPAMVQNVQINPFSDYRLDRRLPYRHELETWIRYGGDYNVACAMGDGSGGAIAIDIDVTDAALSKKITEIAISVLGNTPLRRIGRHPKIALIYRMDLAEGRSIPSRSLAAQEGGHAVEILSRGKQLTFFGSHHITGRPFRWIGKSPLTTKPEELPVVYKDQIETFLNAVGDVMPLSGGGEIGETYSEFGGIIPSWSENKEGKINDGREKFLQSLILRECSQWFVSGKPDDRQSLKELVKDITNIFANAVVTEGRWDPVNLGREIPPRVFSTMTKLRNGSLAPKSTRGIIRSTHETGKVGNNDLKPVSKSDISILDRASHAEALYELGRLMNAAITDFLDECNAPIDDPNWHDYGNNGLHIVKAPPGIGKTSTLLRRLAEDPRTYIDIPIGENASIRSPYVMLVPTYRNIDELRARAALFGLDPEVDDETLKQVGIEHGLYNEADHDGLAKLRKQVEELSGPGLDHGGFKVEMYRGRVRAGCKLTEQMDLATKAGLSGSNLCRKKMTKKEREESEFGETEKFCVHYHSCPAIAQADVFNTAHLVLMPHSFLALNIPAIAKSVRGVIIDERAHDLFLHTTQIPLDTLGLTRRPPRLTKKERGARVAADPEFKEEDWANGLSMDREEAVQIFIKAIQENRDPALDFHQMPNYRGRTIIESAIKMCSASMHRDTEIEPNMPLERVERVAAEPAGKYAREEWRLWNILLDRLNIVQNAELAGKPLRGPTGDARIQYLHGVDDPRGKRIRLSWRTEPNWIDRPIMLLDASAEPAIIQKVWQRRPEDVIETDLVSRAGLYRKLKTVLIHAGGNGLGATPIYRPFSNMMIVGEPSGVKNQKKLLQPAQTLARIRMLIGALSLRHASGRVLVGCNIPIRKSINQSWVAPGNVDFGHFGALRGLDVYRQHIAALSIGRLELPIDLIDGLAAALTYDDDEPEFPMDRDGTGYIGDDPVRIPLQSKIFRLRDGRSVEIEIPIPPGRWGAAVQAQYREEELVQFLGRLRPFHRDTIPTWYACSSVLPDDVIIDEIVSIDQFYSHYGRATIEMNRLGGGKLTKAAIQPTWFAWPEEAIEDAIKFIEHKIEDWDPDTLSLPIDAQMAILDKLDETIGSPEVRRKREMNETRTLLEQLKWKNPTASALERGKRWPLPNSTGNRDKLDLYSMFALMTLLVFHAKVEAHYEYDVPISVPDNDDRDYSALGDWVDRD